MPTNIDFFGDAIHYLEDAADRLHREYDEEDQLKRQKLIRLCMEVVDEGAEYLIKERN